jgi:hypothetical protein
MQAMLADEAVCNVTAAVYAKCIDLSIEAASPTTIERKHGGCMDD